MQKARYEAKAEARELSKQLEEAQAEKKKVKEMCHQSSEEVKRRVAKAEHEVKMEADETDKVRVQMNRESYTLQELNRQLELIKRRAEVDVANLKAAEMSKSEAQDEMKKTQRQIK